LQITILTFEAIYKVNADVLIMRNLKEGRVRRGVVKGIGNNNSLGIVGRKKPNSGEAAAKAPTSTSMFTFTSTFSFSLR